MSQAHAAESAIYSTLADDPELAEIVEMFVEELPERISMMLKSFENSDWEGLRRTAHQLKGAAGSYGFQPITELSARLERTVKEKEDELVIRKVLNELDALCRRARAGEPAGET